MFQTLNIAVLEVLVGIAVGGLDHLGLKRGFMAEYHRRLSMKIRFHC